MFVNLLLYSEWEFNKTFFGEAGLPQQLQVFLIENGRVKGYTLTDLSTR